MKSSTKDEATGTAREVKGTLKQAVGKVTGNRELEAEGADEKTVGQLQQVVGKVKKVLGK